MDFEDFFMGVVVLVVVGGFTLFLLFVGILLIGGGTPNEGTHTGYVTAVEKEGIIWRVNSAYFKTDTQSSQEDKYCASDDVVTQLKEAQVAKKLVTIEYKRGFFLFPWECSLSSETEIIGLK